MKKFFVTRWTILAAAALAMTAVAARAQDMADQEIETLQVTDSIYMLAGAGGNTTVQVGEDGILVVDTKMEAAGDKLLAAIREISDAPIRYVVNTHYHPDHTGGNAVIRNAGETIAGGNVSMEIGNASEGAQILAHEGTLFQLSAPAGDMAPAPPEAWPTSTFFNDRKELYFNGEPVVLIHHPDAHTGGDITVFFRKSDVIATGDLFMTTHMYPYIDTATGGGINGYLTALNAIIKTMVPVYGQDGGTKAIPGHGRLSNIGDVLNYREMLTIIRDRVQHMIDEGMSLEEVQAARPTFDYDPRYGTTEGFWTTEMFVEAVYDTLQSDMQTSGAE